MKRSVKSMTLVGSFLVAMGSNVFADEVTPSVSAEKKPEVTSQVKTGVYAEGETLPQNMIRARVVGKSSVGSLKVYGKDGKTVDTNVDKYSAMGTALVVEYGVTNQLTGAVKVPFTMRNKVEANSQTVVDGKTGLGDVEAGALYNVYNDGKFVFTTGLGMRFATGQYADVKNLDEATGEGRYSLGLRLNADYQVVQGLWLSLQDQEEVTLATVKHKASDTYYDKKGISRKAFAQVAYGFGALSQDLKALSLKARYAYDYDNNVRNRTTGDKTPASSLHKVGGGAGVDLTGYNIPVSFDALYMTPVAGKSAYSAPNVEVSLNTYFQI